MKKVLKALGIGLLVILALAMVGALYIKLALPRVGDAPVLQVSLTKEKIERGRYLANAVCVCMDCHSSRDWTRFSGPMIESSRGKGGERFDQQMGFPGVFYSKNITPFNLSRYTDGELFRVITTGVTKEGRAMFPVMPYMHYGKMDTADVASIIAYIRTLSPMNSVVPASQADFPVSLLINTMPKAASPETRPDSANRPAYGRYLVNAGGCIECHTPASRGEIIIAEAFSGGREFALPTGGTVRSSNLTSDPKTGIGSWNEEMFVGKFKAHSREAGEQPAVQANTFNSIMPWTMYANMSTGDLAAIYTYLKTLPPQNKSITKFTPGRG